jgi:hypothetical protein
MVGMARVTRSEAQASPRLLARASAVTCTRDAFGRTKLLSRTNHRPEGNVEQACSMDGGSQTLLARTTRASSSVKHYAPNVEKRVMIRGPRSLLADRSLD